jgi:Protein of unknown function (DUF3714).
MKKEKINQKKLLLIAPVFVLLVAAGTFHALGGGSIEAGSPVAASGINRELPDADFKTVQPEDKLGIYELTARDSAQSRPSAVSGTLGKIGFVDGQKDPTEEIKSKLEMLNRELVKPETAVSKVSVSAEVGRGTSEMKNDVERLEALMKTMQENKEEDPEVTQLNGMLDKILSIQNPDLMQQKALPVPRSIPDSQFRAIPAVIAGKQKVGQGAAVKLRLLDSLMVRGVVIPAGHELFALSSLANHRLLLNIRNIRLGTSIVPVDLSVYSLDGMAGIDAPEAELGIAAGAGADDALQSMQFLSMDQSIGIQAAGAGIDAAKSLLSKKVRKIRVMLRAGTQVLLRDNQLRP